MSKRTHTEADNISPSRVTNNKSLATYTSSDIQHLLDDHVAQLSAAWKGSIPFEAYPVEDLSYISQEGILGGLRNIDLCNYLNGQCTGTSRLYFSPKKYIPPPNNEAMAPTCNGRYWDDRWIGWINLKRDLCTAALQAGNPIYSNGSDSKQSFKHL